MYLDSGFYESNAKAENFFEMDDEFRNKPPYKAKKCFLVGVQPCGTRNGEWSSKAIDYTIDTLNDTYIYVVFKSDKKSNDSYDVAIYIDTSQKPCSLMAQTSQAFKVRYLGLGILFIH